MKTLLFASLIFLGIIFQSNKVKATAFAGAEITYTHIGGSTYRVTLTYYRYCDAISAPNSVAIVAHCGSNSSFNYTFTIYKIPVTGNEITKTCNSFSSSCSGGSNIDYGIEEYIYQGIVSLPPCSNWKLSYSSGTRNALSTILGSSGWHIATTINNLQSYSSAPIFKNKITTVPINHLVHLDYGAIDPDGDSLVYSLYAPFTSNMSSSVTYNPPYSANNFLSSSTPITIDSATGVISCTPNISLLTILGIKIEKWRNISGTNVLIGTIYRDLTLGVINNSNYTPTLSGMDFLNSHTYNANDTIYDISVCANHTIEFDINGYDADVYNSSTSGNAENFTISWNNGISGASFTTYHNNTDSAYAHFSWTPTSADSSNIPKCFYVSIADSACPYYEEITKQYCLTIQGSETLSLNINSALICSDSSITLIATTSAINPNYLWSFNGVNINNPQSTYTYIGANHQPGVDNISISLATQYSQNCLHNDSAIINLMYQPNIHNTFSDTGFCVNDSLVLDAGPGWQYSWKDNFGNIIGTSQFHNFNQSGTYIINVDGAVYGLCTDTDTFNLIASIPPAVNLGADTTIQPYQAINLDAGAGYNYLWSTSDTIQTITVYGHQLGSLGLHDVWVGVYNDYCSTFDTIVFDAVTTISQNTAIDNFTINPNPNNGEFFIDIKYSKYSNYKLVIYNAIGTEVFKNNFNLKKTGRKKINLQLLPSGVYFVKLENEDNIILMKKLIIQ